MDSKYDCKFEEMKKYIPFLENMIKRLESTSSTSNPRQAQLDKIRSLRDLLLDKKKRMKMENLLKCEQVLVNLYAKVEQRDSLSDVMKVKEDSIFCVDSVVSTSKEKSDLEIVRNKLKAVTKINDGMQDTLPEIARASEVQEISTSGSKEPALFQRRPNKSSLSPSHNSLNKSIEDVRKQQSKRSYTRVLVSPERTSHHWSSGNPEEKILFSRRSPRRSPRRISVGEFPSSQKRERKRSLKESRKSKGINITLNVPEESLNSLNTKDILPRIINCSDGDVDIDTLKVLRKQIIAELKKTGANNDISDLLIKSCKNNSKSKKKEEIEEGELSDSESEAIESIYGSLVVKEQNILGQSKNLVDKDNRKIQICLVINSDKDNCDGATDKIIKPIKPVDASDFEMYSKDEASKNTQNSEVVIIDDDTEKPIETTTMHSTNESNKAMATAKIEKNKIEDNTKKTAKDLKHSSDPCILEKEDKSQTNVQCEVNLVAPNNLEQKVASVSDSVQTKSTLDLPQERNKIMEPQIKHNMILKNETDLLKPLKSAQVTPDETVLFKANFYKPLAEADNTECIENIKPALTPDGSKTKIQAEVTTISMTPTSCLSSNENILDQTGIPIEIPLLNEPTIAKKPLVSTVSEIDILQALKNDIFSKSLPIPSSDVVTPPLHQPKIIKVASAQEILPKKRISLETYMEKSVKPTKLYPFATESIVLAKEDDHMKKSRIKLTEKECERFNIPRITYDDDDSSENDILKNDYLVDEIYDDLAPKSPDHDESIHIEPTPPVIIPADPVKNIAVTHTADIDMRNLQNATPNSNIPSLFTKVILPPGGDLTHEAKNDTKFETSKGPNDYRPPLIDPRVKNRKLSSESQSPKSVNSDRTLRPTFVSTTSTVCPNMTPVMTPNARSYEWTPNHQSFDVEQGNRKHVYAPMFNSLESQEFKKCGSKDMQPKDNIDHKNDPRSRFNDSRETNRNWDERDPRSNSIQRDVPQFTRFNDSFNYDKFNKAGRNDRFDNREEHPFNRAEYPLTPLPSFGRSEQPVSLFQTFSPLNSLPYMRVDCPSTPSHPFGRSDCPTTPSHPFGRSDCPTTPSHPFGRSDCPTTPSHPFGRSDCPATPSHPFGRSDCPLTPIHHFGRSDCPTTPVHSFGRSDVPPTSTQAFNRSDCVPNANHSFGTLDCPSTPSHSFARAECPMTPSHPFGRSEKIIASSYGRSDYNSKFAKDPRLNRKTRYESSSQYDEKDHDYYKDYGYKRGGSYKSHGKPYGRSDKYRNYEREHSTNRSDKYRYYADKSGNQFSRDRPRYDRGRSVSRDSENDQHSQEKKPQSDSEPKKEFDLRRYQREGSVGPSPRLDNDNCSTSNFSLERTQFKTSDNKLSVKPDAGRSFTIDTSVNSTFQNLVDNGKVSQTLDYNFHNRRQRAASVGRSLAQESNLERSFTRESSVGRNASHSVIFRNDDSINKREMFRRASSVGRDLNVSKNERSFQEIKADFENYSSSTKLLKYSNKCDSKSKDISKWSDHIVKVNFEKGDRFLQSNLKAGYLPSKNVRDPRLRKINHNDTKMHSEDIKKSKDSRRKSGIDYSNDNIAKGTILGSGCGVRNYKIPKIKRPVEEKSEELESEVEKTDIKEHASESKKENIIGIIQKNKNKSSDKYQEKIRGKDKVGELDQVVDRVIENEKLKVTKKGIPKSSLKENEKVNAIKSNEKQIVPSDDSDLEKNYATSEVENSTPDFMHKNKGSVTSISNDNTERRVTRSSLKGLIELDESPKTSPSKERIKKYKKPIIRDTDSDSEKDSKLDEDTLITNKPEKQENIQSLNIENISAKKNEMNLDSSFSIDDLEMFADNAAVDPVIDNINALIANLDNDIDTSKNDTGDNFTKEITVENMMENITSTEKIYSVLDDKKVSNISEKANTFSVQDTIEHKQSLFQDCNEKQITIVENTKGIQHLTNYDMKDNNKNFDASQSLLHANVSNQIENSFSQHDTIQNEENKKKDEINYTQTLNESMNENTVSTTNVDPNLIQHNSNLSIVDRLSTPDSTINTDEVFSDTLKNDYLVDSTNEVYCETNVTSTAFLESKIIEQPSTSQNLDNTVFDSIDSLISLLQDKSKIKEVLSMLSGKSSDNEKIKKKLEKLSQIMSDEEEDIKDDPGETNTESKIYSPMQNDPEIKEKDEDNTLTPIDKPLAPNTEESSVFNTNDESIPPNYVNTDKKSVEEINKTTEIENNKKLDEEEITEPNGILKSDDCVEDVFKNIEAQETEPELDNEPLEEIRKPKRKKKSKFTKKKVKPPTKKLITNKKYPTTAENSSPLLDRPKIKKPSRELLMLQEDIKEMFIRDDVLSSTGIRMCRLAKLVDDKKENASNTFENEPVVLLEKFKNVTGSKEDSLNQNKGKKKKKSPKTKSKLSESLLEIDKRETNISYPKYKAGPKSKVKKNLKGHDPYAFETESIETNTEKASDDEIIDSDSERESIASCKSFGSSEFLADVKKKNKRKRRCWQAGVIKPKNKKKKTEYKVPDHVQNFVDETSIENIQIPDSNCFIDRTYCFTKNISTYSCRLCYYEGNDIVHHYKNQHPHIEIPLSRMDPMSAKEAIEQCTEINFKAVSKISSEKYTCIFCNKVFKKKSKSVLETFFWHIVSTHTGEYKQTCTKCVDINQCPLKLDIPSPPKDIEGQLIGYICKKCNFTQISLENLKTHVIVRHNDQQTAVYTINLSIMSKKALLNFLRRSNAPEPRMLRSCRSNQSLTETSDDCSDMTETTSHLSEPESGEHKEPEEKTLYSEKPVTIQSKITFETDDNVSDENTSEQIELNIVKTNLTIKIEETETNNREEKNYSERQQVTETNKVDNKVTEQPNQCSDDIEDYPHFKINYTESGAKEYICCINQQEKHFKTTLLISMKKHVQMKHSEKWDGYCYVCKVIVTAQGTHMFKDCLQHYLDKHMDHFPVLEHEAIPVQKESASVSEPEIAPLESTTATKPYINVRPLSELISIIAETNSKPNAVRTTNFPKIESVISLGAPSVEPPRPSPTYPCVRIEKPPQIKQFKYEETQAEVMSRKHRVVLETMMTRDKLIKVFKCAGRFCSFTTDSAEDALLHASTHQRIGGIDALNCSYCDFDSTGNAIDLVMHVFKTHGNCQYSCGRCFYRAAASQLVSAHMTRVHPSNARETVLRTTAVTSPVVEVSMLSREQAVIYYECGHNEKNERCKFRTYTPDKFCEHLQQRHSSETSHPCHICSNELPTENDLVLHMKSHGLKLYQCTWCVYGADDDCEMLAHMSIVHPSKEPQAYLRIITNKDGGNGLRVLPLALLNKSEILTEDVGPSGIMENPVREAERSIELEKLIGHANLIIATVNQEVDTSTAKNKETLGDTALPQVENIPARISESEPIAIVAPSQEICSPTTSLHNTLILKTESIETPKDLPKEILVLDSDEEDVRQAVIDISDEDLSAVPTIPVTTPSTNNSEYRYKKVPTSELHQCPKCIITCRSMKGLKKHLMSCLPHSKSVLVCPHCSLKINTKGELIAHYMLDHREGVRNECGECKVTFQSLQIVQSHISSVHNVADYEVRTTTQKGVICYTVSARKQRTQPKRKLSVNASEAPAAKVARRYLPQDVDKLPINPILDQLVYCSLCEFGTKVRINMVRHLQMHAEQQPVPQTAPVNPVPHLETNEKHFDKMTNLAASSIISRMPDKPTRSESEPIVNVLIPPEAASRYPKYVPDRQRLTCGAKGCSYISVDEQMLKYHWETLHSNTNDYHCVHCPPYQHLDTSKPLTAARILAHLKMHDIALFACSSCSYYHFKREALEKHLSDVHKNGKIVVVREEATSLPVLAPSQSNVAPTMDLKPWQCGLCKFKSMLRPEVIDHCARTHQSKMQYKCGYCPFRTSAVENISKHQSNSHAGKAEDVFYYYYREDSVPDEPDGTPCWMIQRKKAGVTDSEIKTEVQTSPPPSPAANPETATSALLSHEKTNTNPATIDLNLVKKEIIDEITSGVELNLEELCKKYGEFSEPNGLHFNCPLCKVVVEDTREAMQCHLYEELKYRKWGCGLCSYKAFHKNGLNEHMNSEHGRQYSEPIQLPIDVNMEKWVVALLEHQATIIERNKRNLAKLKQDIMKTPGHSNVRSPTAKPAFNEKFTEIDLERAFGPFGAPKDTEFCCPKCKVSFKDENSMKDHLETELTKIRWCCSTCTGNFQTYHEAQFHVKGHVGQTARPVEAIRDPAMRSAWVTATIQIQKQTMKTLPSYSGTPEKKSPENDNNSLLVVRYEEKVITPEDTQPVRRKRPACDSDDENLCIDEEFLMNRKGANVNVCEYCDYSTRYASTLKQHVFSKHFNLKPYTCGYCDYNGYNRSVHVHIEKMHPGLEFRLKPTEISPEMIAKFHKKKNINDDIPKLICLFCEKAIPETEVETHSHDPVLKPDFARKGDVIVKCCICLMLCIDVKSLQEHHNTSHPNIPINYALFKLHHETRDTHYCGYCNKAFKYIRDLKTHHNATHSYFQLMYKTAPFTRLAGDEEKGKAEDTTSVGTYRRCARKSTTKLPLTNSVAKKSTTKLPFNNTELEYSYYNTKPSPLESYDNVTTLMPFCNTMMPFTVKKLSEIIKIEPIVRVVNIQSETIHSVDK